MLDQENQQLWDQLREAQQQALDLEAECRTLELTLELTRCRPRLSRKVGSEPGREAFLSRRGQAGGRITELVQEGALGRAW